MMKHMIRSSSLLLAALMVAGMASAANFTETFGSLTATNPVAPASGNSTIAGGLFATGFGPPNVTLTTNDSTDFPKAADDTYLQWNGTTDQYLSIGIAGGLVGSQNSGTIRVAIPIRVDTLAGTAAANTIDILFVNGTAGSNFGLTVDAGSFRMASSNSFNTVVLSTTAFDGAQATAGTAGRWNDGNWRVLVGQLTPKTDGTGAAKWWVLEGTGFTETLLVNATNLTNARAASDIDTIGFGASLDVPPATTTAISIDNVTFYGDTFATEADFLNKVKQDHFNAPATVVDWSVF